MLDAAVRRRMDYVDAVMGSVREEEEDFAEGEDEEDVEEDRVLFVDHDANNNNNINADIVEFTNDPTPMPTRMLTPMPTMWPTRVPDPLLL